MRALIDQAPLMLVGGRVFIENSRGQILLHSRTDFLGYWSLPGGSVEYGESLEQGIQREVAEETGLELMSLEPIGFASDPKVECFAYPNGDAVHLFAMVFRCRKWRGNLRPDKTESPELQFFDPNLVPPMRPNELKSLAHYKEYCAAPRFALL